MDDHTRDPSVAPPPGTRAPTGWDPECRRWEHTTRRRATEHGVRLFNDGAFHEAHGCFENVWASVNKSYRQGSGLGRPAAIL